MIIHRFIFLGILLTLRCAVAYTQALIPGQSYFGQNNYIEYIAGNMPLILSAPHGGYLEPADIPDRDCTGCAYVRDANTQELARETANAVYALTGCYPHVVINRLHRKKLDANRDLLEAADGNAIAGQAWSEFHAFMDSARAQVEGTRGRGLYIDLHGHGHDIQRMELGYLLSQSELQVTDNQINTAFYVAQSSIEHLVGDNLGGVEHADLLRGENSMGQLLADRGYPAVPSQSDPFAETGEPYFNGGYNTNRYGSANGGTIDGIQIECNFDGVRNNLTNVNRFGDTLAVSLVHFLQVHYFTDAPGQWCQTPSSVLMPAPEPAIRVYPNPFHSGLFIRVPNEARNGAFWQIFDMNGKLVSDGEIQTEEARVSLPHPLQSFYIVKIFNKEGVLFCQKVVHHTF